MTQNVEIMSQTKTEALINRHYSNIK